MPSVIKAVVFRTRQLAATRDFFQRMLNFRIQEISPRHFVVHSKGVRLVFLEASEDFEVEMYITTTAAAKTLKDPNGITIITTDKKTDTNQ